MHGCIVVGTDGSETATQALQAAIGMAQAFSQPLHVVCAYRSGTVDVGAVPAEYAEMIQPYYRVETILAQAEALCQRAGVKVAIHSRVGDAAEAILEVATQEQADLIVVGNRGIGSKARFLLGNVPSKVVHHAPCSTHIVHTC